MQDRLTVTGRVQIEVRDSAGTLKDSRDIDNLVVTTGRAHIASLMQSSGSVTEMTRMALGTSSTAAAAGDTDLGSEITTGMAGTRASATRTNPTTTSVRYSATWTPGQSTNATILEAAIFNASPVGPTSGTMLCRSVFANINKAAGDSLSIDWTITIS